MAIIPDVKSRLEQARAKLASLANVDSEEEQELARVEAEIIFAEMCKKAAPNVRLGRLLLKGNRQVIFRQTTGPELTSVKNAKDGPETEVAWMVVQRKCILHPDLVTYNSWQDEFPLLDQEVATALQRHNRAEREALPGK